MENISGFIFSGGLASMRNEILQTSLNQFLKHGIREMSIQKLTAPLGISTKTVYKYFKNKEQLLEEALLLYYDQQYELLETLSDKQPIVSLFADVWYEAIRREYHVNTVLFQDLHYYYPELEGKIEAVVGNKFTKQFIRIVQRGIKEGFFREDAKPEIVMEGVYTLYNAVARYEQFKRFRQSPLDVLLNTIIVYIRGFCTKEGIQALDQHIQSFEPFGKTKKSRVDIVQ